MYAADDRNYTKEDFLQILKELDGLSIKSKDLHSVYTVTYGGTRNLDNFRRMLRRYAEELRVQHNIIGGNDGYSLGTQEQWEHNKKRAIASAHSRIKPFGLRAIVFPRVMSDENQLNAFPIVELNTHF